MESSLFEQPWTGNKEKITEIDHILREKPYVANSLKTLKEYDRVTHNHLIKVANLARLIGPEIGLTRYETDILTEAALVHDLYKLKVSKEVLNKKEKLTPEDWEEIRKHTSREFFEYVRDQGGLEVARVAIAHHDFGTSSLKTRSSVERRQALEYDTSQNIKYRKFSDRRAPDAQAIGLANILNIIDEFESLISPEREYKKVFSKEECAEILKKEFPGIEEGVVIDALLKNSN